MARTAVLRRLKWHAARVLGVHDETATARTICLEVRDWPGHVAGQHIDLRLRARDGYTAVRSYSIASAPFSEGRIEITVERLPTGEVSPYLTQELMVGDYLELRGPIGGWFVWRSGQTEPVQLIAGGSGIVPLMCMIRSRALANSTAPFRLLYSVREPGAIYYRAELEALSTRPPFVTTQYAFTRVAPNDWPRPSGRIDRDLIASATWPASVGATCYVCGPSGFVESVADLLCSAGNRQDKIKTERFGPTGLPE
ncbi:ferredoxin reductase [Occallatibacter riparius]|uniref:Ferredoxin reductase n=2 Tax=Occallatibacter riparius TaxID=1002689 RepID=A0A9J7BU17_9BACT|nr:ferredoxin reductase [Occallatibacter riparius]